MASPAKRVGVLQDFGPARGATQSVSFRFLTQLKKDFGGLCRRQAERTPANHPIPPLLKLYAPRNGIKKKMRLEPPFGLLRNIFFLTPFRFRCKHSLPRGGRGRVWKRNPTVLRYPS